MLLQQDNTRPHVARVTTQYLRQTNVNVMDDWPALPADLNPIDYYSDYLKKRIRKLQLDSVRDLQNLIRTVAKTPAGLYLTSGEVYEA